MTLVFNGVLEKRSGGSGCKCRGRKTTSVFLTSKSYILPSGRVQTFNKDMPAEVSEKDGKFLLSYNYTDSDGTRHDVFTEV